MRRTLATAMAALGLLAIGAGIGVGAGVDPASAAPAPAPSGAAGRPASGEKVCEITDERLREGSGLIATANGYVVVNDGTDISRNERIFFLDSSCEVAQIVEYPTPPLDPEDLALSPDGETLWIADIGDNATNPERRARVALWSMPADGSDQPEIHRVSYPDGPHDAEALLIDDDGVPIIITKSIGVAGIYRPSTSLRTNNDDPVLMTRVGELTLPKTTTENLFAAAGRITVTGAARSADGARVTVRTYADAFEWDVAGGDIVETLTSERPRITPLNDPFGEAITYTPDGAQYLTVSDVATLGENVPVEILRYTPSTETAKEASADEPGGGDGASWASRISLQDINYLIIAAGLLGAILVAGGVYGIVRARREGGPVAAHGDRSGPPAEPGEYAPITRIAPVRTEPHGTSDYPWAGQGQPAGGGVYGGRAADPGSGHGAAVPVVDGRGAVTSSAGVYGAAKPAGGGVYGAASVGAYRAAATPIESGAVYGGQPSADRYQEHPGAGGDYPVEGYSADRYQRYPDGGRGSRADGAGGYGPARSGYGWYSDGYPGDGGG